MTYLDIFFLALALSADAFTVSFSYGLVLKENRVANSLKLSFATGFAQFLMPVIGWYAASFVHGYIEAVDHWISFIVFLLLGLNIIWKGCFNTEETPLPKLNAKVLFMLSLATSIDALAAGVSIYFASSAILFTALAIGVTTFICSNIGYNLNCCFKKLPMRLLAFVSGTILILLGVKVLYEHCIA